MPIRDILYIIALVILLALSAVFSALDMAYSSVKLPRLERESAQGDKRSKKALAFANNYDSTIATVLFGDDFVNILASSIASLFSYDILEPVLGSIASTISSLALLFLLLVFGEISPKALAKDRSHFLCRHSTGYLTVLKWLFFPFVTPINAFARKATAKLIDKTGGENPVASDDELEAMVDTIQKEGIIDADQTELLHKSIDFKETNCYEIMTPRVKIHGYDIETPLTDFLKDPDCFKHSRLIIFKRDLDHILGYVQIKSLLKVLVKGQPVDIQALTMPILSVPRTMMISSAMALMKENHHHIAVVKDEYGGTEGIITMEDILEELVGELWDENDQPETFISKVNIRDTYLVHGNTNIDDFLNTFGLDPDELSDEYTTVSGFITHQEERFPKVGDVLSYKDLTLEVIKMDGVIVDLCLVSVKKDEKEDTD
ncbi:MAG: hemolysin family protein [Bacilli bacterium]|jgi:putative hemolysin|nr:hemolysin family protein [Bacilli bacterium]